ncbi:Signal peptide peptidase-like 3 [Camellia lanceoleosa]|uniref:Signal peptide peptidase-like 3 n=1 Tax=Camellia lanceoleosa TaxID=1840588 RepID=A0ACC0G7N8_9ERIC|nr:Signal peptide peptidase-like 3 [Camellia lanceoleosa]
MQSGGAAELLVIHDKEDLLEMSCREKNIVNIKISIVMIAKSGGEAINKSMTAFWLVVLPIAYSKSMQNLNCLVMVVNCYGEFVESMEPPMVGADLIADSLIKKSWGNHCTHLLEIEVIFADGTFIDGSISELSGDGPLREPFAVYCQSGTHWTEWGLVLGDVLKSI